MNDFSKVVDVVRGRLLVKVVVRLVVNVSQNSRKMEMLSQVD